MPSTTVTCEPTGKYRHLRDFRLFANSFLSEASFFFDDWIWRSSAARSRQASDWRWMISTSELLKVLVVGLVELLPAKLQPANIKAPIRVARVRMGNVC